MEDARGMDGRADGLDTASSMESGTFSETPHSESGSSGRFSVKCPHYNPDEDVITRTEWIQERGMKVSIVGVQMGNIASLVVLSVALYWKVKKDPSFYLEGNDVPKMNLGFGCACLLAVGGTLVGFLRRVYRSYKCKKRWSPRRKTAVTLSLLEQVAQCVNLIAFITSNAIAVQRTCDVLSPFSIWGSFVQWTCWNALFSVTWLYAFTLGPTKGTRWENDVKRADALLADLPLWKQWRKLWLFVIMQALIVAATTLFLQFFSTVAFEACPGADSDCRMPARVAAMAITPPSFFLVYLVFILHSLFKCYAFFNSQPYNLYQIGNQILRLNTRLRSLFVVVILLTLIVYSLINYNTCGSINLASLGYLPMHIAMSVVVVVQAYHATPKRPSDASILRVWLQEFSWTEGSLEANKKERSSSLPASAAGQARELDAEPMWCFETAMKLNYWTFLCYDYKELNSKAAYNVDTALSLYDLHSFEMLWERSLDTKCLIGWSDRTLVVAFRGTASIANVASDLQVWRTPWPEAPGHRTLLGALRGRARVHAGFLQAYRVNGFDARIKECIAGVLAGLQPDCAGRPIKVYVTGHSLGGALATLCAYDIAVCEGLSGSVDVSCYTFGAPRTGNHVFAELYTRAVPDTWHIINNDDAVTRNGKFFMLYKRAGFRVLINARGDCIVRPNFVEQFVHRAPGGGSLASHFLTSYQKSLVAVLAAQFGRKSLVGGKQAVFMLTSTAGTCAVLKQAGLRSEDLERLESEGLKDPSLDESCSECSCMELHVPSPLRWWQGPRRARRAIARTGQPDCSGGDVEVGGGDGPAIKHEVRLNVRPPRQGSMGGLMRWSSLRAKLGRRSSSQASTPPEPQESPGAGLEATYSGPLAQVREDPMDLSVVGDLRQRSLIVLGSHPAKQLRLRVPHAGQ
ncbi:hypothetical protein ACKKBG_A36695 [Auxenochlorella protothecoides x Auxenochlorella symbiontica]